MKTFLMTAALALVLAGESVFAAPIDLRYEKSIPQEFTQTVERLSGRQLRLIGGSIDHFGNDPAQNGITCEQAFDAIEQFYTYPSSRKDGSILMTVGVLRDEPAVVKVGKIGTFEVDVVGVTYTYGKITLDIESGRIVYDSTYTYIGANVVIPGKMRTDLRYTFNLSAAEDLSGSVIQIEKLSKGGGVHYKRACRFEVLSL